MKITLTGINFNFSNGYDADFTGVNLSFNNSGATFNISGYIEVTKEEYMGAGGVVQNLIDLIKNKIIEALQPTETTSTQS